MHRLLRRIHKTRCAVLAAAFVPWVILFAVVFHR